MRFFLAIILCVFASHGITQESPARPDMGKVLPNTTKPLSLISEVKGKPLISVSEYRQPDSNRRQRVFRYSWQGDHAKFLAGLKKKYLKKDGWTWEYYKESQTWDLTRMTKTGGARMESYLIKGARLEKDAKVATGLRATYNKPGRPSWIWISYNEQYAK